MAMRQCTQKPTWSMKDFESERENCYQPSPPQMSAPGGKSVHWPANLASPSRDMPVESFYRHVQGGLFGSVPIRVTFSMNRQVSDCCAWGWSLDGLAIWDRYAPSVSWAVGPLPSFGRLHGTSRPREANANGRAIREGQTRRADSRLPNARLERPGPGPT